jgi:hypothetical protein
MGRNNFHKQHISTRIHSHPLSNSPLIFNYKHLQNTQLHRTSLSIVHSQSYPTPPVKQEACEDRKYYHHQNHMHWTVSQNEILSPASHWLIYKHLWKQYWWVYQIAWEKTRHCTQKGDQAGWWAVLRDGKADGNDCKCVHKREVEENKID